VTAVHHIPLTALRQPTLAAITMLPILLVVVLSAPAWLVTPFLPESRRESIAAHLREIHGWHSDALDHLSRSWQEAIRDSRGN
jgi:hypothetical protein